MFFTGSIIYLLLHYLILFPSNHNTQLLDFVVSVVTTTLVWEGNFKIEVLMDKKYPWEKSPGKRILYKALYSLIFSVLAIYLSLYVSLLIYNKFIGQMPIETKSQLINLSIVIGILVVIIVLTIEVSAQFFNNWKSSLVEVEKYKTESALAQLQNLKNQIDPHFLFNNMSILTSLVNTDTSKAVNFIGQLSKVYRYLLDNKNNELVTLHNELEFIKSYTYLLQIRFDSSIIFNIDIPANLSNKYIPPMALQMLIENAIKHNEVSEDFPLTISIVAKNDKLIVSNNLQLRRNKEPNSNIGLQNIKDRYKFFSDKEIEIVQSEKSFVVTTPLLNKL